MADPSSCGLVLKPMTSSEIDEAIHMSALSIRNQKSWRGDPLIVARFDSISFGIIGRGRPPCDRQFSAKPFGLTSSSTSTCPLTYGLARLSGYTAVPSKSSGDHHEKL